mmetsp:Transcript_6908/g.11344  ORF Transcript_6908/g.11344 Transcript_6908/m.11344 type:complete len:108 (-) Transcript_6908:4547-4870(-)
MMIMALSVQAPQVHPQGQSTTEMTNWLMAVGTGLLNAQDLALAIMTNIRHTIMIQVFLPEEFQAVSALCPKIGRRMSTGLFQESGLTPVVIHHEGRCLAEEQCLPLI